MTTLKKSFLTIYRTNRSILWMMILNLLCGMGLFIFAIVSLNPESAVVKIGYGDIGGYRDGTWVDLLAFAILAIIFGVLHNFLALNIFKKRGGNMTKFFLIVSMVLSLGAILVLARLMGEG